MKNFYNFSIHLLFWIISVAVFSVIFRLSGRVTILDFFSAFFYHIALIPATYINFRLIKLWLFKEKFWKYAISVIILTLGTLGFCTALFEFIIDLAMPGYFFVSQFSVLELLMLILAYLAISSVFPVLKRNFELQNLHQKVILAQKAQVTSELQGLKAQLNPHFLFNTLNVIYSLVLKKDDETPDIIIKLSNVLRYVVYETKNERVLLSSERSLLRDYIEIQSLRFEKNASISMIEDLKVETQVAPLLFLTLLENSFKHGTGFCNDGIYIKASLSSTAEKIIFWIENFFDAENRSEPTFGTGLTNLKKRLELIYPNQHFFDTEVKGNLYKTYLEIKPCRLDVLS
jgi:sensor histidine kinase YesM